MNEKLNDRTFTRKMGCLIGQAVGDALGARYEFKMASQVKKLVAADDGDVIMAGDGPFDLLLGQITDDTELALTLASSLVNRKKFDINNIAVSSVVLERTS